MQTTISKNYKSIFLFVFFLNPIIISAQIYQSSVFKGVNANFYLSSSFNSVENINPNSTFTTGIGAKLYYCVSENIGVYFKYFTTFNASANGKEIGYFIFTDKFSYNSNQLGMMYNFLSPMSNIRISGESGITFNNTDFRIIDEKNGASYSLNLSGIGFSLAIVGNYFLKPFLSIELGLGIESGKYKRSEYFGTRYKESLGYSFITFNPGITYHFSGR